MAIIEIISEAPTMTPVDCPTLRPSASRVDPAVHAELLAPVMIQYPANPCHVHVRLPSGIGIRSRLHHYYMSEHGRTREQARGLLIYVFHSSHLRRRDIPTSLPGTRFSLLFLDRTFQGTSAAARRFVCATRIGR